MGGPQLYVFTISWPSDAKGIDVTPHRQRTVRIVTYGTIANALALLEHATAYPAGFNVVATEHVGTIHILDIT